MLDITQIETTLSLHGYEIEKHLGKGSYSNVLLCQSSKYHQQFAIKCAIKKEVTESEYKIMISLNHPNIIKLYDTFEDDFARYLVTEYCPNGTIRQKGKLTNEKFVIYAKQILEAVSYCHSHNIAHRDIKPDNIFLDQYDQIKLTDFGFAKQFDFDNEKCEEKWGSLRFMAPEMLQCQSICPFKADIWALGITFFFMATGSFPFCGKTKDEMKQLIILGQFDFDKYLMSHKIRFLISKMTAKNINLRAKPDKLLRLPIFTNNEKNNFFYRKSLNRKSLVYTKNVIMEPGSFGQRPAAFNNTNSFKFFDHQLPFNSARQRCHLPELYPTF